MAREDYASIRRAVTINPGSITVRATAFGLLIAPYEVDFEQKALRLRDSKIGSKTVYVRVRPFRCSRTSLWAEHRAIDGGHERGRPQASAMVLERG